MFHADADVEPISATAPGQNDKPSHPGEDTMNAAERSLDGHTRTSRDDEETPLLGNSQSGKTRGDGKGNEPSWSGTAEFKGRPWWRKPSVGHNH